MTSPAAQITTVLLPFLLGGFFWGRGLWRCRMGDCVAGTAIGTFWACAFPIMAGTNPIHALGGWAAVLGIVILIISPWSPEWPPMKKADLRACGMLLLFLGLLSSIVL